MRVHAGSAGAVRKGPRWLRIVLASLLVRAFAVTRDDEPAVALEDGAHTPILGPPFTPGRGPTTSAWREEAITRANELEGLAAWIEGQLDPRDRPATDLLRYVKEHLAAVRRTAAGEWGPHDRRLRRPTGWMALWRGASHERVLGNLDAVEATLIRLAPDFYLRGEMPSLEAHVNRFLPKADPRRTRVERLAAKADSEVLNPAERSVVVAALHAANSQRRRDLLRVRNFRNVMFIAAALLVPLAIGLGAFGAARTNAIPLCFHPQEKQKVVCPTEEERVSATAQPIDIDPSIDKAAKSEDIALVEAIGLIAAIVGSAVALRNLKGTSTPYSLAVALALLKIPLGALTAVLGLLLLSGGFIPGLSALDSSAQILAWALVFGFSQQLVTRLVDQRANTLLENVGGHGAAGDRERVSG